MTGVLDTVRQQEYTGENRCLACTVVNTVLAVVLAGVVAGVGWTALTPAVGVGTGLAVLAVSLAAIALRGYLVPGTPELTKQYLPRRVLAWFGKAPERTTIDSDLDPEAALVSAGALTPCENQDDLCLDDEFRAEWYDEIDRLESANAGRERLLDVLGLDAGSVDFQDHGEAFRARVNGSVVGRWESEAAFLADVAGAAVLLRASTTGRRLRSGTGANCSVACASFSTPARPVAAHQNLAPRRPNPAVRYRMSRPSPAETVGLDCSSQPSNWVSRPPTADSRRTAHRLALVRAASLALETR